MSSLHFFYLTANKSYSVPYLAIVRKFDIQTVQTNPLAPSAPARAQSFFDRSRVTFVCRDARTETWIYQSVWPNILVTRVDTIKI